MKNFDRVADVYDDTRALPPYVLDRIVSRVVAATQATTDTSFLEIGVGTGRIALPFLERGYRYTGVDISERMMDRLRAKLQGRDLDLTLLQADITHLPLEDASFDVVLGVHILHLVPEWQLALQEARRVLRSDGYLLLGHENSAADDPPNEIRHQWRKFVTEAGVELGLRARDASSVDDAIVEGGSYAAVYRVAHWEEEIRPSKLLDEQRRRVFSQTWDVPDDVLESVHGHMQEWVTARYGSPDAVLRSEREFLLAVHRFPPQSE